MALWARWTAGENFGLLAGLLSIEESWWLTVRVLRRVTVFS